MSDLNSSNRRVSRDMEIRRLLRRSSQAERYYMRRSGESFGNSVTETEMSIRSEENGDFEAGRRFSSVLLPLDSPFSKRRSYGNFQVNIGPPKRGLWNFRIAILVLLFLGYSLFVVLDLLKFRNFEKTNPRFFELVLPKEALCKEQIPFEFLAKITNPSMFSIKLNPLETLIISDDQILFKSTIYPKFGVSGDSLFKPGPQSLKIDSSLVDINSDEISKFISLSLKHNISVPKLIAEVNLDLVIYPFLFPIPLKKKVRIVLTRETVHKKSSSGGSTSFEFIPTSLALESSDILNATFSAVLLSKKFNATVEIPSLEFGLNYVDTTQNLKYLVSIYSRQFSFSKQECNVVIDFILPKTLPTLQREELVHFLGKISGGDVSTLYINPISTLNDHCLLRKILSKVGPIGIPLFKDNNSHRKFQSSQEIVPKISEFAFSSRELINLKNSIFELISVSLDSENLNRNRLRGKLVIPLLVDGFNVSVSIKSFEFCLGMPLLVQSDFRSRTPIPLICMDVSTELSTDSYNGTIVFDAYLSEESKQLIGIDGALLTENLNFKEVFIVGSKNPSDSNLLSSLMSEVNFNISAFFGKSAKHKETITALNISDSRPNLYFLEPHGNVLEFKAMPKDSEEYSQDFGICLWTPYTHTLLMEHNHEKLLDLDLSFLCLSSGMDYITYNAKMNISGDVTGKLIRNYMESNSEFNLSIRNVTEGSNIDIKLALSVSFIKKIFSSEGKSKTQSPTISQSTQLSTFGIQEIELISLIRSLATRTTRLESSLGFSSSIPFIRQTQLVSRLEFSCIFSSPLAGESMVSLYADHKNFGSSLFSLQLIVQNDSSLFDNLKVYKKSTNFEFVKDTFIGAMFSSVFLNNPTGNYSSHETQSPEFIEKLGELFNFEARIVDSVDFSVIDLKQNFLNLSTFIGSTVIKLGSRKTHIKTSSIDIEFAQFDVSKFSLNDVKSPNIDLTIRFLNGQSLFWTKVLTKKFNTTTNVKLLSKEGSGFEIEFEFETDAFTHKTADSTAASTEKLWSRSKSKFADLQIDIRDLSRESSFLEHSHVSFDISWPNRTLSWLSELDVKFDQNWSFEITQKKNESSSESVLSRMDLYVASNTLSDLNIQVDLFNDSLLLQKFLDTRQESLSYIELWLKPKTVLSSVLLALTDGPLYSYKKSNRKAFADAYLATPSSKLIEEFQIILDTPLLYSEEQSDALSLLFQLKFHERSLPSCGFPGEISLSVPSSKGELLFRIEETSNQAVSCGDYEFNSSSILICSSDSDRKRTDLLPELKILLSIDKDMEFTRFYSAKAIKNFVERDKDVSFRIKSSEKAGLSLDFGYLFSGYKKIRQQVQNVNTRSVELDAYGRINILGSGRGEEFVVPCVLLPGSICPNNFSRIHGSSISANFENISVGLDNIVFGFPISISMRQNLVLEISVSDWKDIIFVSISSMRINSDRELHQLVFSGDFTVEVLDFKSLSETVKLLMDARDDINLKVIPSSDRNQLSALLSGNKFSKIIRASKANRSTDSNGKIDFKHRLVETSATHGVLSGSLAVVNPLGNIILNIGRVSAAISHKTWLIGNFNSNVILYPGENDVEFSLEVFGEKTRLTCQEFPSLSDPSFCGHSVLLSSILGQTPDKATELTLSGIFLNSLGMESPILLNLLIGDTAPQAISISAPRKPILSLNDFLRFNSVSVAKSIEDVVKSAITGESKFELGLNFNLGNPFNFTYRALSYNLDLDMVDYDGVPPYVLLANYKAPPDLHFELVENLGRQFDKLLVRHSDSIPIKVDLSIPFKGVGLKIARVYDEIGKKKRLCLDVKNLNLLASVQASETHTPFAISLGVNYKNAAVFGSHDCDAVSYCFPKYRLDPELQFDFVSSKWKPSQWQLNHDTHLFSDKVVLLPHGRPKVGSIFSRDYYRISESFEVRFSFSVDCPRLCGEGFAFVIQKVGPTAFSNHCPVMKTAGYCHGQRRLKPSVSVVFDVSARKRLALILNGSGSAVSVEPSKTSFKSKKNHEARIVYNHFKGKLFVYLDEVLHIDYNLNFSDSVFGNTSDVSALMGFTARSGLTVSAEISLFNFSLRRPAMELQNSLVLDSAKTCVTGIMCEITVRLYDQCGNALSRGGYEFAFKLKSIRSTYPVLDAHDHMENQDGTYSVRFKPISNAGVYYLIITDLTNEESRRLNFVLVSEVTA